MGLADKLVILTDNRLISVGVLPSIRPGSSAGRIDHLSGANGLFVGKSLVVAR